MSQMHGSGRLNESSWFTQNYIDFATQQFLNDIGTDATIAACDHCRAATLLE